MSDFKFYAGNVFWVFAISFLYLLISVTSGVAVYKYRLPK
jgi:hypothetical protein